MRRETIQTLWGGYGQLFRDTAADGTCRVVKDIRWPPARNDLSHRRKLRSYEVEAHWYSCWAEKAGGACRLPSSFGVEAQATGMRLVLEDLDAAGFSRRTSRPQGKDLEAAVAWLARFHATFLGTEPEGLWEEGSYWHLGTRPEELEAMPHGPLREAAGELDRRLREARFRTVIHGDAKPDNFCFGKAGEVASEASVAMVDFQYVGGGCGMRDLAYLLDCVLDDTLDDRQTETWLARYFEAFRKGLAPAQARLAEPVEEEWRALFPVAWLDFQRFLQGWSPAYARPSARMERRLGQELSRL